jgi:hypothetical protein
MLPLLDFYKQSCETEKAAKIRPTCNLFRVHCMQSKSNPHKTGLAKMVNFAKSNTPTAMWGGLTGSAIVNQVFKQVKEEPGGQGATAQNWPPTH